MTTVVQGVAVGEDVTPRCHRWTEDDALLYAVGVGGGSDELGFTTENTRGEPLRVLPTFAVVLGQAEHGVGGALRAIGSLQLETYLHGEQTMELRRALPTSGEVEVTGRVTAIYDKGSGAVVVSESEATDRASGEVMARLRSAVFARGAGGFGGDRGPKRVPAAPQGRPPDQVVTARTSANQALLYRLSGDRNPLHTDPAAARAAGFERPVLHGLCTFGFAGRALLHAVAGGDPGRCRRMHARFVDPVYPGEELVTMIWRRDDGSADFVVEADGRTVVDDGRFELGSTPEGPP
jgi:acyl dehydratase